MVPWRKTLICGSRTSPATTRWTGCASTTSRRSPRSAGPASSRCAPRRWRSSTPKHGSRTCGGAVSTSTTSGAMRAILADCGGARRWIVTAPTEPDWDVLLDVDALADTEDENWVWAGADVLEPDHSLALIELSRGGADATVVREFDMDEKAIRHRRIRAAGSEVEYHVAGSRHRTGRHRIRPRFDDGLRLSADRQAVAAGPTTRATPQTLFEGESTDVSVGGGYDPTPGFERLLHHKVFRLLQPRPLRAARRRVDPTSRYPPTPGMSVHREWLLIRPRTEWTVGAVTYRPGSLLAVRLRRIPLRHRRTDGRLRTRRALQPGELRVDARPPGARHARRRGQPRGTRDTWNLGTVGDHRHPAEHQHRAGGHRRVRRRDVPGLKRFRHAVAAAVGTRGDRR